MSIIIISVAPHSQKAIKKTVHGPENLLETF